MPTSTAARPDIEAGAAPPPLPRSSTNVRVNNRRRRRRRRSPRPSVAASSETTTDGSFRFSDTEDDSHSMHSQVGGGSYDECSFSTETEGISVISDTHWHGSRRGGSVMVSEDDFGEDKEKEVDLESGALELKVHRKRERRRECRICHLSLSVIGGRSSGDRRTIELGCCCKGDLGSAHKQCAETWFKIKGNTICEICGASAVNIAGEQPTETNNAALPSIATTAAPPILHEARSFWHGRRVMNFLLACMIFAFIISWLFHFKILR